jgi:hypothetical protein
LLLDGLRLILEFMRPHRIILALALIGASLSGPAAASTILPAADPGELARTSDAVLMCRVLESSVLARGRAPLTIVKVEVLSVVTGPMRVGERLEIAVPGGAKDGRGWLVAGAPQLRMGSEYLIFAGRHRDGRWRPRLLADGVLRREVEDDGTRVLVPLEESLELERLGRESDRGLVPGPMVEHLFVDRLREARDGRVAWSWRGLRADSAHSWPLLKVAPVGCAFLTYQDRKIRWQRFDLGGSLAIWSERAGDPDLADGGVAMVSGAVDRWMSIDGSSLDLSYAGSKEFTMTCTDGEEDDTPPAGADIVVFDDPCDDIDDLAGCSGTLAFGGPWFGGSHAFDGENWFTASSWFVVVNNGVSDCLSLQTYELMLAHELGHGLGFGHTNDERSLMYANCCSPHNQLDAQCTQYLYPSGESDPNIVTVPVIAFVDGVGGTPWRSDVVIANPTDRHTVLDLSYQPGGRLPIDLSRSLPPRSTLLFENIVGTLFGAGDGRGPLRVTAQDDRVTPIIVSRTYAVRSFGNIGSGLHSDIEPEVGAVSMPGLFDDSEFRSNISVTARTGETVTATIELFRGRDGLVETVSRTVPAGEQEQWKLGRLFPGRARARVPMTVRVTLDRPAVANASVVDNGSTDSAVFVGKRPSTDWTVPAVVHAPGRDSTVWTSVVSLWNASGGPVTVDLELLPVSKSGSQTTAKTARISLQAFETRVLDDPVLELFAVDDAAGALRIEASGSIVASSRVATAGPNGGSSGNGVRTVHGNDWATGSLVLPGVRLLDGFRTNVGFVAGDRAVDLRCRLYNGNGSVVAESDVSLAANSFLQRSVEQVFGGSGFPIPDPVGTIVVEGNHEFLAYLTTIDGTSQDPVFVMPR